MRITVAATLLLGVASLFGQNLPAPQIPAVDPPISVKQKAAKPSKHDQKKARQEFSEGMKLKKKDQLLPALDHFRNAADLDPKNVSYATARETTRVDAVMEQIQRGNRAMESNSPIEAQADYREALRIDPNNQFALQQLRNALPPISATNTSIRYSDDERLAPPIQLIPANIKKAFSY